MNRIFLDPRNINRTGFEIYDAETIHYAMHILRLKNKSKIEMFDGLGNVYEAVINILTREVMAGSLLTTTVVTEPWKFLILAQSLPRAGKLGEIIRMNTEVGVSEFVLFESEYSVTKLSSWNGEKESRLQRKAIEASKQCGRPLVPPVHAPITYEEMIKLKVDLKIVMHTKEVKGAVNLTELAANKDQYFAKDNNDPTIMLIIGPEGGFSPSELTLAQEHHAVIAYLNLPIMRTETAGVVASGIMLG